MKVDLTVFSHIATSLAKHFDCLYYVDIDTNDYIEFIQPKILASVNIPKEGKDFFVTATKNAYNYVHPDDLSKMLKIHDKANVLKNLANGKSYSVSGRVVRDGKMVYTRFVVVMCEDQKHLLCGMENIDDEVREKEEQAKNLLSAERMARRDELTGIKNKNAFAEHSQVLDGKIRTGSHDFNFAVLMCDLNDLKMLNDTRGHAFGDEALQRASAMICDVFKHSPVFRIGGDEFVAILTDYDYDRREQFVKELRERSEKNGRFKSGPELAVGLAVYDPYKDNSFSDVFTRADRDMYENKNLVKSRKGMEKIKSQYGSDVEIPEERKRMLDSLFGALHTVAGGGYIYLCDMRYDYSRWALSLIDDFGLKSEYMYHADKIWEGYVHPDDLQAYREAIETTFHGSGSVIPLVYRIKKPDGSYVALSTRGFIMTGSDGNPDYFGGIMFQKK
ncbi:MAG: diguanylate cyclase [Treponema sp.]|nr:diguanylate cyclase [Treponema sp.]